MSQSIMLHSKIAAIKLLSKQWGRMTVLLLPAICCNKKSLLNKGKSVQIW